MKLITKEIENGFVKQGYTGNKSASEINVICKLFNPIGSGTWYLFEKEDDDIYMAYVNLGDPTMSEIGRVSLHELQSLRLPLGMKIERDINFRKRNLQEIMDIVKNGGHA